MMCTERSGRPYNAGFEVFAGLEGSELAALLSLYEAVAVVPGAVTITGGVSVIVLVANIRSPGPTGTVLVAETIERLFEGPLKVPSFEIALGR